jgi:integrase
MAGIGLPLNKQAKAAGFTARFIPFKGKKLKDGRHPVLLQLIHNGQGKRYSTKEAVKLDQWDEGLSRVKARVKGAPQANGILNSIEAHVCEIVDALVVNKALSLENFDARYRNPKATGDLCAYMEDMEVKIRDAGRTGYSIMFRNASSALRRFKTGRPVKFHEVTSRMLEELEAFLRSEGCTAGGIATYFRVIRVAVNKAIEDGLMAPEQYPFGTARHKGYSMRRLKPTTKPRALDAEALDRLKAFPFNEHPQLGCTVRLFLFSYYARGINFADIARLKHSDIVDGRLGYTRTKTKRKGEAAIFSLPVSAPMAEIMAYFRDQESMYLFPVLKGTEGTEAEIWKRIKDRLQHVNRDLKAVAKVLDIPSLTFYVARHTYATTLKRKGVDLAVISESMGHENVSTTTAYLKRFENGVLDAADQLL